MSGRNDDSANRIGCDLESARSRALRASVCIALVPLAAMTAFAQSPLSSSSAHSANTQGSSSGATVQNGDPAAFGEWDGPWQLPMSPYLKEIAHASVLPNESGRVIFWTRIDQCDNTLNFRPTETWLWDPSNPGVVPPPILVPNDPYTDMFCAGTTFDSNGNLVVAGGHDAGIECSTQAYGTAYGIANSFRFVHEPGKAPENEHWEALGTMSRQRWYPTALALADGSILVSGHFDLPAGAGPKTVEAFDRWTSDAGWSTTPLPNKTIKLSSGACSDSLLVITDYPRTFVLAHSGEVMIASGVNSLTAFLRQNDPSCSVDSWRWRVNTLPGSRMVGREGGNAVQYVLPDETLPGVVHDVVYVIAGAVHDATCLPAPFITATVDKMVDPEWTKSWDTSTPDMHLSRSDCNSVVLLDGSILTIGGYGDMVNSTCTSRLKPEMYRPPELFADSKGWAFMAPQTHERRYHSVAGLLPDGRVFSAGGDEPGVSHHSIEIYSPPYMAHGQRPVVSTLSTTDWSWNHPVKLKVSLAPGASVARVALLRPGSITHAFDMNQRYIQLRLTGNPVGANPTITVQSPKDWNVAPPGYYFVTVIDTEGRPSPARLVRIH